MKKIDSELFDPAVEPIEEKFHRVMRGAISMIPLVNGVVNEIFTSVLESPLSKRRTQWMHSVTEALNELTRSKQVSLESLQDNDEFIDVLIQATLIAQRTSQQGKIAALRNAVSNSSNAEFREVKKSSHFLRLLDSFDEWHLKVLDFYYDANKYVDLHSSENHKLSGLSLIKKAFPELAGEQGYVDSIWYDLKHAGLITPSAPGEIGIYPASDGNSRSKYGCMVTPLAVEFLNFISISEIGSSSSLS